MESPVISDFSITHGRPDAEGSLNYQIKLQVDNPTESAVELLWHRTVFYDSDGMPVSCSEDSSEDYLSKGEKGHLSFYAGYFNEGLVKFQPDDVSASVFVALCRAEVFEYPTLQISDTPNQNVKQDKAGFPDVVGDSLKTSKFTAWVSSPDDDGEVYLNTGILLENTTSEHIYKCYIRLRLLGENGRLIAEDYSDVDVPYRGARYVEGYMSNNLKPRQLSGTKLHVVITSFPVVAIVSATKTGAVLAK